MDFKLSRDYVVYKRITAIDSRRIHSIYLLIITNNIALILTVVRKKFFNVDVILVIADVIFFKYETVNT